MDDDYDAPIFFGSGAAHDLADRPYASRRLDGLKSVKNTLGGVCRLTTSTPARPLGFHIPGVRNGPA